MNLKRKIKIRNPQGLHARPASVFVSIANKYGSEVAVSKGRERVNGKSIMGLLTLAASQGSTVWIETSGADAPQAMRELEAFLLNEKSDHA